MTLSGSGLREALGSQGKKGGDPECNEEIDKSSKQEQCCKQHSYQQREHILGGGHESRGH